MVVVGVTLVLVEVSVLGVEEVVVEVLVGGRMSNGFCGKSRVRDIGVRYGYGRC